MIPKPDQLSQLGSNISNLTEVLLGILVPQASPARACFQSKCEWKANHDNTKVGNGVKELKSEILISGHDFPVVKASGKICVFLVWQ